MKRILLAATALVAASAAAYADVKVRWEEHSETTYGAPSRMTVQQSPLSSVIVKRVEPGSDDDGIWGLSAPPGTSLGADLTAKISEIAQKEKTIKAALDQLATGNSETLLFAQDACRLSNEAGAAYHAAFRKFHATVTRGTGTGEFRAYPEEGALDIASRRYTRAMSECLIAVGPSTEKTEYVCSYSACTQVPVDQTAAAEVRPCSAANKDVVCRASP